MNCLPIGKRLRRYGQILSKMLPSSSKMSIWRKNCNDDDKENILSRNDSSYGSYIPSYKLPDLSSIWQPITAHPKPCTKPFETRDFSNQSCTVPDFSFYNKRSDHDFVSSSSSGYESFDAESTASMNSTLNSIPYSPLSSFNIPDDFKVDFKADLDIDGLIASLSLTSEEHKAQYDDIRREFEMNGRTEDLNGSFSPSQCSTPMTSRRSQQGQGETQFTFKYKEFVPSCKVPLRNSQSPLNEHVKKKIKPDKKSLSNFCVFCKNNGEQIRTYRSHKTKDALGRVICPILRDYKCPICQESGDNAHTMKYCPQRPIITLEDTKRKNFKI